MVVDITKGTHIKSFPNKIASMNGTGGNHVYNIVLQADADNGTLASRGSYISFDQYESAVVTANAVEGIIRELMADGTWLVEITKLPATEVLYIYNSPVSEYNEREFNDESLMYNKAGEVAQGANLVIGDMYTLSDAAFTGTPVTGKTVKYAAGKYVVQ